MCGKNPKNSTDGAPAATIFFHLWLPLPHRELQCTMAALTRAGKRYYILVHGYDPGELPVHTGSVPETFETVASYLDHWRAGIDASGYHILKEDKEEEDFLK